MTLGQRIKKARTDANLTQKTLADELNVTFQTVSKWENDTTEPDLSTLRALAKLLGCKIEYLISDDEEAEAKESDDAPQLEESEEPAPAPEPKIIGFSFTKETRSIMWKGMARMELRRVFTFAIIASIPQGEGLSASAAIAERRCMAMTLSITFFAKALMEQRKPFPYAMNASRSTKLKWKRAQRKSRNPYSRRRMIRRSPASSIRSLAATTRCP